MNETREKDAVHFDDLVARYMKGELADAEAADFLNLISGDPECRNKAVATARLAKAMHEVGIADDADIINLLRVGTESEVRTAAAKACGAGARTRRLSVFRLHGMPMIAAASVILCLVGGYENHRHEKVSSLGAEYLTYFPVTEFSRGGYDSVDDTLRRLYSDIEAKRQLRGTIAELEAMWQESRSGVYNDYTVHMYEIGWMLANAYLRDNDKERATGVLDILISEAPEGSALAEKSRELRARIEEL